MSEHASIDTSSLRWFDFRQYPSSVTPQHRLAALIHKPAQPAPLLVTSHGWHGTLPAPRADQDEPAEFFTIHVDMRGRRYSDGAPDCNGWELQDWVDAAEFARREYGDWIRDPEVVFVRGGSGAGGNVYALLGKFPDFATAAVVEAGISDYALWYRDDARGEFRDEMDPWVGVTPEENPEAYAARSGLTLAGNRLTPLVVFHGVEDERVPVEHARLYEQASRRAGRAELWGHEFDGVGRPGHFSGITDEQEDLRRQEIARLFDVRRRPPALPDEGELTIGGYVKTRRFEVLLDSVDHLGAVRHSLDDERERYRFLLSAPTSPRATVRVRLGADAQRRAFFAATSSGHDVARSHQWHDQWLSVEIDLLSGAGDGDRESELVIAVKR